MPDVTALTASPLHALCVYAEPLVAGRRVVVFGPATDGLGERLVDLGARVVHLYDPNEARAARVGGAPQTGARGLTVRSLPAAGADFDVRDGAFDLAIIPDVTDLPTAAAQLGRIRRLLATGGAALVGARNPAAGERGGRGAQTLDYYELYDLVALQFAHVRMVGQMAWSGVLLAELGRDAGEPDVSVDTQLVTEADAPRVFFALASQDDVRLAEYSLIQLPLPAPPPSVDIETTIAYGGERADLAAAQLRANLLEAQLEELRGQRNAEGAARAEAVGSLESELAQRLTKLEDAEARARDSAARGAQLAVDLRARDEELARTRDRATLQLKEIDDERRLRARAEIELAVSRRSAEAAAEETRSLLSALERVPQLEVALTQAEARALELSQRVAEFDDERARYEASLASSARQIESVRASSVEVTQLSERAASAEARAAALELEVDALAEGLAADLVPLETSLRDRAQAIHALELELARRERIIHDLVHALDEARAAQGEPHGGEHEAVRRLELAAADAALAARELETREAAIRQAAARIQSLSSDNAALTGKLDALALEVARREGELATSAWRIQELERENTRLDAEQSELTMTIPPPAFVQVERAANDVSALALRLSQAEDEVEVLRQALAQEHDARAKAESGEALSKARAELARQAALLEQLSRELEAGDRVSGAHNDLPERPA